jgi:hypothetical protein
MKISRSEPELGYKFQSTNLAWPDRLICGSKPEQKDFNLRMFDQDFSNIFSRSGARENMLFSLNSSHDELALQLLAKLGNRFGGRHFGETEIDNVLSSFIENVSQSLMKFKHALYYLVDGLDIDQCSIEPLRADRVFAFAGKYIQFLPQRKNEDWQAADTEIRRELRVIDRSKLLCFQLPKQIRKMIAAQNKVLATIDAHQFSSTRFFSHVTLENPNPINHFDFQAWKSAQDLAIYRATRQTGWHARKWDSSKRSDFFDCHRAIRFRRNQLTVGDSILRQLSQEFTRVGKRFQPNFHLEILPTEFLPSIARLNELEVGLSSEAVSFKEVIDYCYR